MRSRTSTLFHVVMGLTLLISTSCSLLQSYDHRVEYRFQKSDHARYNVDSLVVQDSSVAAYLKPYQVELEVRMNRVIGYAETDLRNRPPEGMLGDIIADMMRRTASQKLGYAVDVGLTNWGGIRVPIPKGPITVGDIYTVLPFENVLVVLTFSGRQLQDVANQLAATGGQPISGLRMRIENGKAYDILVGNRPLVADEEYTLVTNDFMAEGGDGYTILKQHLRRQDLNILLRDAMINYVTERYQLAPTPDSRLR